MPERERPKTKSVSVKVPEEQFKILKALAFIDQKKPGQLLREAVLIYISNRTSAPDFPEQVAKARARLNEELSESESLLFGL